MEMCLKAQLILSCRLTTCVGWQHGNTLQIPLNIQLQRNLILKRHFHESFSVTVPSWTLFSLSFSVAFSPPTRPLCTFVAAVRFPNLDDLLRGASGVEPREA